jgi:HlyD family secretion protein
VTWQNDRALKVPSSALFRGGDEWFVFVNQDGVAKKTPLQIGHRNEADTEVVSGLSEGQQVVLFPSDLIVDGVRLAARAE